MILSAAACGPSDEPEASAGWGFAVAAAQRHDVWVVTRPRFQDSITAALRVDPELARHLQVEYLDLPDVLIALRRHSWDLYWFYALWQYALARRVRTLHRTHAFDVAHHVTFANDWLPCGLNNLRSVPLVWGPVGGASVIPIWRLRRWLGRKGFLGELVRGLVTGVPRSIWGDSVARRAAVVVAQNGDVARRFRRARRVVIEPNAALETGPARPRRPRDRSEPPTAIFVGRLIGLKGARLALAAIARTQTSHWRLRIYGDGQDRHHLERMSSELGLDDRVEFLGHRPRSEVLEAYATADALLLPSMHDQAGWAVAEASSAGCPVVCLPLGGPPILAGENAFIASLEGDIVANLADQLTLAGANGGTPHSSWSRSRLAALVDDWYDDALRASSVDPVGAR